MSALDRIWLHEMGDGTTAWCTDPNPSGDPEEAEQAVEYVRADLLINCPVKLDFIDGTLVQTKIPWNEFYKNFGSSLSGGQDPEPKE